MTKEPDYERLIEEIIIRCWSDIRDGKIPSVLATHDYVSPEAIAYWRHRSPVQVAESVVNDAVRATFRTLRERGMLP